MTRERQKREANDVVAIAPVMSRFRKQAKKAFLKDLYIDDNLVAIARFSVVVIALKMVAIARIGL